MNRTELIHKAAALPQGDSTRRQILASLRSAAATKGTVELRYMAGRDRFSVTIRRLFGADKVRDLPPMAEAFEREVLSFLNTVGTIDRVDPVFVAGFAQGAYLEISCSGTPSVLDEGFYRIFNAAAKTNGFRVK